MNKDFTKNVGSSIAGASLLLSSPPAAKQARNTATERKPTPGRKGRPKKDEKSSYSNQNGRWVRTGIYMDSVQRTEIEDILWESRTDSLKEAVYKLIALGIREYRKNGFKNLPSEDNE